MENQALFRRFIGISGRLRRRFRWPDQSPGMLHNMPNAEYTRYMALNKSKSEMIQELKTLMNNDGDL